MKRGLYDDVTLNRFKTFIKLPNYFTYVYTTSRLIYRILQTGLGYKICVRIILFKDSKHTFTNSHILQTKCFPEMYGHEETSYSNAAAACIDIILFVYFFEGSYLLYS